MKPSFLALRLGETEVWVPTYGVAVTLGIFTAIVLAARQAPAQGFERNRVVDLCFGLLVAGLLGARLAFVGLHAGQFAQRCFGGEGQGEGRSLGGALADCLAPLRIWDGGLVFYGGALAAAGWAYFFARRRSWSFAKVGDLFAPGLALGHAVGRLGCFGVGCCFGKACLLGHPPGVAFPPGSVAYQHLRAFGQVKAQAAHTGPLHPTQLYESAALLALFFLLLWWMPRRRRHGQVFLVYLVGYAVLRFVLEMFRGDANRRFVMEVTSAALARSLWLPPEEPLFLSIAQAVSLGLLALAGALAWTIARGSRRVRQAGTPPLAPEDATQGERHFATGGKNQP